MQMIPFLRLVDEIFPSRTGVFARCLFILTNLVFSFLNYIYVWGNPGRDNPRPLPPPARIRKCWSLCRASLPYWPLGAIVLPESAGQQHRVTCRGSRVNCGPQDRRPRERPVDSGAPQIAKTPRIPSSRGRMDPSSSYRIRGQDRRQVWGVRGPGRG